MKSSLHAPAKEKGKLADYQSLSLSCQFNIKSKIQEVKKNIKLNSTITCPHCGFKKEEKMPTDSCLFFYECTNCGKILKPKAGDCCVYCSYGTIKCPPIQETGKCNC